MRSPHDDFAPDTVDFPDQRIHDVETAHGEALLDDVDHDWPGLSYDGTGEWPRWEVASRG